jgi:hypothetical protein
MKEIKKNLGENMKLYTWEIPTMYVGFDVGYIKKSTLCVLAKNILEARKIAIEKIRDSVYPRGLKDKLLEILNEKTPIYYIEGAVEIL